jgi:hypothetical protein
VTDRSVSSGDIAPPNDIRPLRESLWRYKGAVLIRLETDVGGLPQHLKSWRVCARGGSRKKKTRAGVSSAFRLCVLR